MTRNPTKEEIEQLISFLPIFGQDGFDPIAKWEGGEAGLDGVCTFPWPVYKVEVMNFFSLVGRDPWCDYDYARKDVPALIRESGYIEQASLEGIKTILTYCVRGERFCDGYWGAVMRDGLIERLLKRLLELADTVYI